MKSGHQWVARCKRLLPHLLRPGHLRNRLRRGRDVLTVGDLDGGDAEYLIAQARRRSVEIGELLRGEDDAHSRPAAPGKQRDNVIGAKRRELIDPDHRRQGCVSIRPQIPPPQAVTRGRDQILDHQRSQLRRELPVGARVEAEQHDLISRKSSPQVDCPCLLAGARAEILTRMRLADDRQACAETANRTELVWREPREIVLNALAQFGEARGGASSSSAADPSGGPLDRASAPLRVGMLQHLEDGLDVTLSRALVVGLGEALGSDQLVLQLGGVPMLQGVPVARSVRSPGSE